MAYDGKVTLEVGSDTKPLENDVKKLANKFKESTQAVEKQVQKVDELKAKLSGLKSGEITAASAEVKKMQSDFDKATASIGKTQSEIQSLYGQMEQLQANAFKDPISETPVFTEKEQAQFNLINAKLDELEPKLEADKQKAAEMGEALKNATGTATQAEIKKTTQDITEAETKLEKLKITADETGEKLKNKMAEVQAGTPAIAAGFEKLGNKLVGMAKRVFVFAIITKALRGLRTTIGSVLMSDENFRNSLYQLQAAFWTAFAPILNFVVPALKTLVSWITSAVVAIGRLIAALTGKSYSAMVDEGKALQKQTAAYAASTKAKKKNAKATKDKAKADEKELAVFDEINKLQDNSDKSDTGAAGDDSGGVGGGVGGGVQDAFGQLSGGIEKVSPELSALNMVVGGFLTTLGVVLLFMGHIGLGIGFILAGLTEFNVGIQGFEQQDFGTKISPQLSKIMEAAGIALVALGLILLYFGQIGWGLGAIVAGIVALSVKELTSTPYDGSDITTMMSKLAQTASIYMLCIGLLVMLTPGNFLIGLGLVVGGIALLKYSTAQLGSQESTSAITNFFKEHEQLITGLGIALVVIGLFLCCCGKFFLGMYGILAGSAMIWTEASLNGTDAKNQINNFIENNKMLIVGVAAALLVIGILLMVVGGSAFLLGLGLTVSGAVILGEEAVENSEEIKNKINTFISDNRALIDGIAAAMLVLGVILVFTGVGIPLGLGLIAAGGGFLAEELVANWSFITDKVAEVWENLKKYWKNNIAKYFTSEWWGNLAKDAMAGFIKWIIKGFNKLANKINSFGFDMPDALGGGHVGFNIPTLDVPALARGAVIPANREFLAVLGDQKHGTNIEAPLTTIVEAMNIALAKNQGNQNITIEFGGTMGQLVRILQPEIKKEQARRGVQLVTGGGY